MKWELLLPGCTTNSPPRPRSTTHCGRPLPSDWQRSRQVDLQLGHVSLHRCLPHAACWRIFCNVTLETPPFRLPTQPPAVPRSRVLAFRSTACHSHFGLDFARIFQLHYFSQQWKWKEVETCNAAARSEAVPRCVAKWLRCVQPCCNQFKSYNKPKAG